MRSKVLPSETLPSKVSERRTKPLPSRNQTQGHQWAIATLFLGTAIVGFGVGRGRAFEIGIGQIIQGHRDVQAQAGHAPD